VHSSDSDFAAVRGLMKEKAYMLLSESEFRDKSLIKNKTGNYFFLKASSVYWDYDIDQCKVGYTQVYKRKYTEGKFKGNYRPLMGLGAGHMNEGDKIVLYQTGVFKSVYAFMTVVIGDKESLTLEISKLADHRTTLEELRSVQLLNNIGIINSPKGSAGSICTLTLPQYKAILKNSIINQPLNQILYGPPGTGKTYSTITKALDIIGVKYTDYEEAQELFQNELGKRIEFVTMHQSFSYEDFVQGLKPKKGEKGIEFDYKNGVFKEISERAWNFDEISKHSFFPSYVMARYEDLLLESDCLPKNIKKQDERLDYFADLIDHSKSQILVKDPRDCFDRLLGDKSPREGWTKDNYKNKEVWYTCENTVNFFNLIPPHKCIDLINKNWVRPSKDKVIPHTLDLNNIERVPHVIILDEINRANISRVFGELIALIEEDKRDGKLTATLPSGEPFTVPSNLHIIGTMNTADKSIALVDIALRRRFKFVPMYPKTDILEEVLGEMELSTAEISLRIHVLKTLNRIIRSKKSVDFEIGHSYFMSNDTLVNIMNDQILPLLNEYFMYDLRVVKELLEKQQKDKDGSKIPRIGISLDPDEFKERGLLKVVSVTEVVEIPDGAQDDDNDSSGDDV